MWRQLWEDLSVICFLDSDVVRAPVVWQACSAVRTDFPG